MKVLRVLGLIFGILLLLTGGALMAGSAVVAKGSDTVQQQIAAQGLKGPVKATVVRVRDGVYTVKFKADDGKTYTVQAESAMATPPKSGDTVSVFYQADDPTSALISNAPVGALTGIAGTLRTAGIIALVIGGLLLVGAILGFVFGKKSAPAVAPAQNQTPQYPTPQYPGQGGYPAPMQNYPAQQQTYPAQQQTYPAQQQTYQPQGNEPQGYPPQQPQSYPTPPQSYPTPPPYPPQPPNSSAG